MFVFFLPGTGNFYYSVYVLYEIKKLKSENVVGGFFETSSSSACISMYQHARDPFLLDCSILS